jgi:hypothetical protein
VLRDQVVPWPSGLTSSPAFAFGVAASADVGNLQGRMLLSIAAVAYAVITGLTLYASGHVERRVSPQAGMILDRIADILLTSIAVILLAQRLHRPRPSGPEPQLTACLRTASASRRVGESWLYRATSRRST